MKKQIIILVVVLISINLMAKMIKPQGSGTETDPYLISSMENLVYLSKISDSGSSIFYLQTRDIDASETQNLKRRAAFTPISSYYYFSGHYDGGMHKITNLYIDRSGFNNVGLFGSIDNATIKNVILENVTIIGLNNVGGLCGKSYKSKITNCFVDGRIFGEENVGAIIGLDEDSIIFPEGEEHESYSMGCYYNYQKTIINSELVHHEYAIDDDLYGKLSTQQDYGNIDDYFTKNEDYYLVNTIEEFKHLFYFARFSKYKFRLMNDLDFKNDPNLFIPVSRCSFDGNYKIIKNLKINYPNSNNIGLFGRSSGDYIKNLGIENCSISGYSKVGAIAGYRLKNYKGSITYCYTNGRVKGNEKVGGLVGHCDSSLSNSYSLCTLESANPKAMGGCVGYSEGRLKSIYFNSDLVPNSHFDEKRGLSTSELKNYEYMNKKFDDFAENWIINPQYNDGYLSFKSQITKFVFPQNKAIEVENSPKLSASYNINYESFDLYFGSSFPPENKLINEGKGEITYKIGYNLDNFKKYFWRVVIKPGNGHSITEDYSFTTRNPWQGLGTKDNPIIIRDLDDLQDLSKTPLIWDKVIIQTADIDAKACEYWNNGQGFSPVGNKKVKFTGSYDGGGYNISNIVINKSDSRSIGFWGNIENANISNVKLIDINIKANSYSALLVGSCYSSRITDCYVKGKIDGSYSIGGLIGGGSSSKIENSLFEGEIKAKSTNYLQGTEMKSGKYGINYINCYYIYESSLFKGEKVLGPYSIDERYVSNNFTSKEQMLNKIRSKLKKQDGYLLISSIDQFKDIRLLGREEDAKFRLTKDLDMSMHEGFAIPLFKGELDGDGHKISNITINKPNSNQIGFFYHIDGGSIYNLKLENVDIAGKNQVGGLVGNIQDGIIDNCSVLGVVKGNDLVGGIAGKSSVNITNCISDTKVSGRKNVGGIVGESLSPGGSKARSSDEKIKIESCQSSGTISSTYQNVGAIAGYSSHTHISYCSTEGEVVAEKYAGGLAGRYFYATISNSYSLCKISGKGDLGGIIGRGSFSKIEKCYFAGQILLEPSKKGIQSDVGGIASNLYNSSVIDSFWDDDICKYDSNDKGMGRSSNEMKKKGTYTKCGWDFQNIWNINMFQNSGYPYLRN